MTRFLTTLLAGAALIGTVSAANATTIDGGTVSLSPTLTDINGTSLGNLNLFDTTLGTLTSVTFTTIYGFSSTITVSSNSSGNGNAKTESAAKLSSDNSAIMAVLNSLVNKSGTAIIGSSSLGPVAYDVTGPASIYTVSSGSPQTFDSSSADATKTFTTSAANLLTPFQAAGGGTFDVLLTTLTGTDNSVTGGNASASQFTQADASVDVTYTYTATPPATVPEPASMALLGAGLLGAGLVRRRSSK